MPHKRASSSDGQNLRRRKSHKKSRTGCVNCRFRRVKCDESKPNCQKCRSYMVPCKYVGTADDLGFIGEQVAADFSVPASNDLNSSSISSILSPTPTAVAPMSFYRDHEIILRFQHRTALTLGDPETVLAYAEGVPRLAMQHKFLWHTVLATTLLHDRALAGVVEPTHTEAYHLSQAAALFNNKLSMADLVQDKDALWSAAVYLCAATIFNVNTPDPEKTWPLRASSASDLEWLRLQAGLRVMWNIADFCEDSGIFAHIEKKPEVNCVHPGAPVPGIAGIPKRLVKLCNLTEDSTGESNVYHAAVRHLTWLLPISGTSRYMLHFMVFAGGLSNDFRFMLEQKDPRCLLLMGIWYSKLFRSAWWMAPRAFVECRSICIYLKRLDIKDTIFSEILDLVSFACYESDLDVGLVLLNNRKGPPRQTEPQHEKNISGPTSWKSDLYWLDS